jgi:YD repeat-containing protein
LHDLGVGDSGGINATTQFAYDARDNLTAVTDPKGLVTQYVYDGLNDLDQRVSPDTGTTDYGHDAAGNRVSQTDARGITTGYAYDALNRLTRVSYPNAALDTTFQYDFTPADCQAGEQFGIGRYVERDPIGLAAGPSTCLCTAVSASMVRQFQT